MHLECFAKLSSHFAFQLDVHFWFIINFLLFIWIMVLINFLVHVYLKHKVLRVHMRYFRSHRDCCRYLWTTKFNKKMSICNLWKTKLNGLWKHFVKQREKWCVNLNDGGCSYKSYSVSFKLDFILRIVANLESMVDCYENISIKQNIWMKLNHF